MELIRSIMGNIGNLHLQSPVAPAHAAVGRMQDECCPPVDNRQHERMPSNGSSRTIPPPSFSFDAWSSTISSSLKTLRRLAGATEREFLHIGNEMQGVYHRSATLSQDAQNFVEAASGERVQNLTEQLRQILSEMEAYLDQTQSQNANFCTAFDSVGSLLEKIAAPLEGFKKMSKNLYILEVLIKIESAHIGESGHEFINLALDINKLTQQIKEKSNIISNHRVLLTSIISKNIKEANAALETQKGMVLSTIANTATSISGLDSVNQRFSMLGNAISSASSENANHISQIVQSMQFHDIFRQQVEHVIEALEGLLPSISGGQFDTEAPEGRNAEEVISKAGDVCELQEAQLQFASVELYAAVSSIVSNLSDISGQQKLMAQDIYAHTGMSNTSDGSFIDDVSHHMTSITELLTTCAGTNADLAVIMKEVTDTVNKITGFVSDIENIGQDINQIALNARIKAASTGPEGASMCVLAEEIGHLSQGDVQRTESITSTLTDIEATTGLLFDEAKSGEENLTAKLIEMKTALNDILAILENMGTELFSMLSQIHSRVNALSVEIEKINRGIDVHERCKAMADEVLSNLRQIFNQSRELYPASAAFKEDLRRMAERYTMESERRIHEDIARKHGVITASAPVEVASSKDSDSEFGDNFDLF